MLTSIGDYLVAHYTGFSLVTAFMLATIALYYIAKSDDLQRENQALRQLLAERPQHGLHVEILDDNHDHSQRPGANRVREVLDLAELNSGAWIYAVDDEPARVVQS